MGPQRVSLTIVINFFVLFYLSCSIVVNYKVRKKQEGPSIRVRSGKFHVISDSEVCLSSKRRANTQCLERRGSRKHAIEWKYM